jgi:hypothetical protein
MVAHACNPSYSGGRNQGDCSLDPISINPSQNNPLGGQRKKKKRKEKKKA